MALDPSTLTVVLLVQNGVLAFALAGVADVRRSPALRWGVAALVAQALAWGLSGASPDASWGRVPLSEALSVASAVMAWHGVQAWLGPRWGLPWAWGLPVAVLLLHASGASVAGRTGGVALLQALAQAGWLLALWRPASDVAHAHRRWRWVLSLPLGLLAALNLVRALMAWDPSVELPLMQQAHPVALAGALLLGAAHVAWALACVAATRAEAELALAAASQTDALTGLANRRTLEARGLELIAHARRHGDTLVALMVDLDHLQQINDRHGPALGDACLVLVAECLQSLARPGDCVARVGGEEFVVLLGRTRADGALAFDRRLREALQAQAPERLGFFLNVSAGWALLRPGDRHLHDLLQRADAGLYRAKAEGRGRLAAEPGLDAEDDA